MISDAGIFLEIAGFILLLLVGNRNPTASHRVLEGHKENPFDNYRKRIIPDKYVRSSLPISIVVIVLGLILQLSYFIF